MADQPTAINPELLALRTQIDALDRDLLALLNQRAALALQVGEVKKKEGSVAFRPEREAQVIDGLKAGNRGPLSSSAASVTWINRATSGATSPTPAVKAASPCHPSITAPQSIEMRSPSARTTSSLGMPCTTIEFGEAQITAG